MRIVIPLCFVFFLLMATCVVIPQQSAHAQVAGDEQISGDSKPGEKESSSVSSTSESNSKKARADSKQDDAQRSESNRKSTQAKPKSGTKLSRFTRAHHPWASFKSGAWRSHRVVTESVDERGEVSGRSTTSVTQSLDKVTGSDFTLREQSTLDVQNKLFRGAPQWVTSSFFEACEANAAKVTLAGEGNVTIEEQEIPCQVYKVVVPGENKTRTTRLYFNSTIYPYVLRREVLIADNEGKSPSVKTTEQVTALKMPFQALSETVLTSHVRTERVGPKGTTVTVSIHSARVPGGIVASWTKELDSEGHMNRRTMLELTDYDLKSAVRVRSRRRNRRSENEFEDSVERVSDRRHERDRG